MQNKIEKVPRGIQGEKSSEGMVSSRKLIRVTSFKSALREKRPESKHGSFCSMLYKPSEKHSLQNSPRGGQDLLVSQGFSV